MFKLFKKRGKKVMTKEEFLALTEEQKKEILNWVQEPQGEQPKEVETQDKEVASQKIDETEGQEKLEETKTEIISQELQTEENGGKQEQIKEVEVETDENKTQIKQDEYNAQEDIKKFGKDLETLMAAQAETLKKYEELSKINSQLKTELEELKKTNPMGNYQFKPSDDEASKADKERDSFVDKYRNAYKN